MENPLQLADVVMAVLVFLFSLQRRIGRGGLALGSWLALAAEVSAQALATPPLPLTALFPHRDQAESQARLVGQVSNSLGQPVAGAQVHLEGLENLAQPIQTDEQGAFELNQAPAGRRLLTVWHPDYEKAEQEILLQAGLTTPVEVVLQVPLRPQPRRRLGILGVGGLDHTRLLSQRLAIEVVRLGLIPNTEKVVPLDNRRLQPILRQVGWPIYELFEWDRRKPEAVSRFFDYLGLEAIVIARVDVLTRPTSPTEVSLRSRSRLELWRFDEQGNLVAEVLAEASRNQVERGNLNADDLAQLYQIQVTQMAAEIGSRWKKNHPLASYLELAPGEAPVPPSRLDTAVELVIPTS
ncbi:carboxypeptidase-like regulatory domain-containing protein [Synechococcus sp. W65.1]|uniref:carboxypeptidase-like regulatory domain-containing protein n=1 Tax=Synechococcus sp. W65.1 TaxID=2964526 RepID=UPI0039C15374